jgi:NAD(P)H-dependent FMN reductase
MNRPTTDPRIPAAARPSRSSSTTRTPALVHRPAPRRRTHGLVVTGSLRQDSQSRAIGEALVVEQPWLKLGPSLDRLPFYDADLDALKTPETVLDLRERVKDSELIVIVTPEYNGAVPGLVANAVDWLSRPLGAGVLTGRRFQVVSVSQDARDAAQGGYALAATLERAGGISLTIPVAVPEAETVLAGSDVSAAIGLADLAARVRAAVRADARDRQRTAA